MWSVFVADLKLWDLSCREFLRSASVRAFHPGDTVYQQGRECVHLHCVVSGECFFSREVQVEAGFQHVSEREEWRKGERGREERRERERERGREEGGER